MEEQDRQRLSVTYRGRVQGVGFRASVADLARNFRVTGRICNVTDGTVELVVEGEESELFRFQRAILECHSRNVVNYDERWAAATGEWSEFAVTADRMR